MNKNKKTIVIIAAFVVIASFFVVIGKKGFNFSAEPVVSENQEKTTISDSLKQIGSDLPGQTLPLSNDPKDVAWAVFQKYLGYNEDQNLEGVKNTVYKVASVCEDPKTTIDCKARMNLAYKYGSTLKKEDFKNIWSDEKQIILSTNFWTESSKDLDQYGRFRSIIFFIKGTDNEWKLLSFSPAKGGAINKGEASQEEVDQRLIRYTEDNDQDGRPDYEEECLQAQDKSTCTQTNPKLRDTDGNGFWDGVEALMK